MNIVLFHPQIPQNTGNIARTCALCAAKLHLIKPLGFSISSSSLKRAGLDYWKHVDLCVYDNFEDFLHKNSENLENMFIFSSKASRLYTQVSYPKDAFLIFGSETSGLPDSVHQLFSSRRVKIPMLFHEDLRCLNLSNSAAVALYEALRQNGFLHMQ